MLNTKKNRTLALLLAVALICTLIPATVFASEGGTHNPIVSSCEACGGTGLIDDADCESCEDGQITSECTGEFVGSSRTAPTCTVDGYVPYTCKTCGASYQDPIPATGIHTHANYAVPTLNESGTGYIFTCTGCGEEYETDSLWYRPQEKVVSYVYTDPTSGLSFTCKNPEEATTAAFYNSPNNQDHFPLTNTDIVIPDTITVDGKVYEVTVPEGAFGSVNHYIDGEIKSPVTSVVLPRSVTTVSPFMFYNATALKSVTFTSPITAIEGLPGIGDGYAFSGCNLLETLNADFSAVTSIPSNTFSGCWSLNPKNLNFNAVEEIGANAFYYCNYYPQELYTMNFPSIVTIGANAFRENQWLETITLGENLESIGANAFYGNFRTTAISFADASALTTIENNTFYKNETLANLDLSGASALTTIGASAFYNCKALDMEKINFSSVATIGSAAFYQAGNSRMVDFDLSLPAIQTIGNNAFRNTYYFETLDIGSDIETIGDAAFMYAGASARDDDGARNVLTITIDSAENATQVGTDAFLEYTGRAKTIVNWLHENVVTIDLIDAIENAEDGNVTINGKILPIDETINITESLTIDGGGKTVKADSDVDPMITIKDGQTLTLKNITFDAQRNASVVVNIEADGTLILEDGATIKGATGGYTKGAVVVNSGAAFTMNGGLITGNTLVSDYTSSVMVKPGGYFEMNDGAISGNRALFGGAVQLFGLSHTELARFTMNGGTISGNTATNGGGGVLSMGNATFNLTGGTISGNTSNGHGGGIVVTKYTGDVIYPIPEVAFNMTGGTIENNRAAGTVSTGDGFSGDGGGIYINSPNCFISGGNILNNTSYMLGGGVYVEIGTDAVHFSNALITENSASVMGGGVWTCPTGDLTVTSNSAAIYGNSAEQVGADIAVIASSIGSSFTTLSNRMLGGGYVTWYKDGMTSADTPGNFGGIADYTRHNPEAPIAVSGIENSAACYALKANPVGDSLKLVSAGLLISGNSAAYGGGIGINGWVEMGDDTDEMNLTIKKVWNNVAESNQTAVTVQLIATANDVDYLLEKVTLSAENNWSQTIAGLSKSMTYSIVEDIPSGMVATYSEITAIDDSPTEFIVTVTNAPQPSTPNRPTNPTKPEEPIEIPPDEVPLTELPELPETPTDDVTIVDENVPLGDLPHTGANGKQVDPAMTLGILALVLSLALVGMNFLGKKKREEA